MDVSIVSPHVGHHNVLNTNTTAADRAETGKIKKYREKCENEGVDFEPFVLESTGAFGKRTDPIIQRMQQGKI